VRKPICVGPKVEERPAMRAFNMYADEAIRSNTHLPLRTNCPVVVSTLTNPRSGDWRFTVGVGFRERFSSHPVAATHSTRAARIGSAASRHIEGGVVEGGVGERKDLEGRVRP